MRKRGGCPECIYSANCWRNDQESRAPVCGTTGRTLAVLLRLSGSAAEQKRRGGDSNPRSGYPNTAFPVLHNRPLCHLSPVCQAAIPKRVRQSAKPYPDFSPTSCLNGQSRGKIQGKTEEAGRRTAARLCPASQLAWDQHQTAYPQPFV